jgi:methyl-accepting chemotaxis protein
MNTVCRPRAGLGVRAQLAVGFAAIGALLVVAAALVVQAGLGVQAALADSAERAMPKWQGAHAVALAVSELARLTRDAVLVEMQEDLPIALDQMQAVQQRLQAAMRTLRAAPDDDGERALLQRVEDAAIAFERDRQAFIVHLQGGARGLARGMLTGALRQSQSAYLAALDAHRAMQRLSWQLALAFAAIAAVGTVVALWLARSLSRRLGADPREVAQAMRTVSDGDLGARLPQHARCAPGLVMASLLAMVAGLRQAVRAVRSASDTLAERSETIVSDSEHLSRRTEQQSAELQQAAAALEQFAASMAHSRQNVRDADTQARSARGGRRAAGPVAAAAGRGGALQARRRDAGGGRAQATAGSG